MTLHYLLNIQTSFFIEQREDFDFFEVKFEDAYVFGIPSPLICTNQWVQRRELRLYCETYWGVSRNQYQMTVLRFFCILLSWQKKKCSYVRGLVMLFLPNKLSQNPYSGSVERVTHGSVECIFTNVGASEVLNVSGLSRYTRAFANIHSGSHGPGHEWWNVAELEARAQ